MPLKKAISNAVNGFLVGYGYKKSADNLTLDELWARTSPGFFGTTLGTKRGQLNAYLGWVYAAASNISTDVAQIDLHAYANRGKQTNGKVYKQLVRYPKVVRELKRTRGTGGKPVLEELDNHILLDLLDQPNPVQSSQEFIEMLILHLLLTGEAYVGKIRNGLGKPAQLWPMMPFAMTPKGDPKAGKLIDHWVYRINGTDTVWDVDDVMVLRFVDPSDMTRGMSVVRAAARAIDTDTHSADWNKHFFQNAARPDLMLMTDQKLSPEVHERMKSEWQDGYSGAENAGKTAILEQGLKAEILTVTQKDMDFLEGRKFNRDEIFGMFGISRVMLGIIEGDGRSNMDAAEYNHTKRVIKPIMTKLVAAINHNLAPEYDSKLVIGFTDPVPEDKEFILKERTASINVYRTINEVREELGDEPLDGGDLLYLPINLIPMGAAPPETQDGTTPPADQTGKGAVHAIKKPSSTAA